MVWRYRSKLRNSRKNPPLKTKEPEELINGLHPPHPAPKLDTLETWLNSRPIDMEMLKGKVVLVNFWSYTCTSSIESLPQLIQWHHDYQDKGLIILGIHAPEFEPSPNFSKIQQAIKEYQIPYPVAVDTTFQAWKSFPHTNYWPADYLISKKGDIVYIHFGKKEDDITENNIRFLLNSAL